MNYIFLQEGYDPHPDPNSICVKALLDELRRGGDRVYVVCDGVDTLVDQFSPDPFIHHVRIKPEQSFYKGSVFSKIKVFCLRVLSLPIWPIRFPGKVRRYVKRVEALCASLSGETTLVAVFRPAEMLEVGYRLKKKHPGLRLLLYNLDGTESNVVLGKRAWFIKKENKWQMKRYRVTDGILQMQTHKEAYLSSAFAAFRDKTRFADYPLILPPPGRKEVRPAKKEGPLTLVYGGAFYKSMREPTFLLSWFKAMDKEYPLRFSCYTRSFFTEEIEAVGRETGGHLQRLDYIPPAEMERVAGEADCLISLGNLGSRMVPSKIFVYISACQPIIHFYREDEDSSLPYLKKYKKALLLDEREGVEKAICRTKAFFDKIRSGDFQEIDFGEIEKTFPENTPAYTVDMIREAAAGKM